MRQCGEGIVLIGFMGSGKSAVGRTLAERLGLPRVDTDELVQKQFNLEIPEIFKRFGEDGFRDAENAILEALSPSGRTVLVTGGGSIMRRENVELLRRLGVIVHLFADEAVLFARVLRQNNRPLLRTPNPRATLRELCAVRAPLYRNAADLEFDTSHRSVNEIAELIIQELGMLRMEIR